MLRPGNESIFEPGNSKIRIHNHALWANYYYSVLVVNCSTPTKSIPPLALHKKLDVNLQSEPFNVWIIRIDTNGSFLSFKKRSMPDCILGSRHENCIDCGQCLSVGNHAMFSVPHMLVCNIEESWETMQALLKYLLKYLLNQLWNFNRSLDKKQNKTVCIQTQYTFLVLKQIRLPFTEGLNFSEMAKRLTILKASYFCRVLWLRRICSPKSFLCMKIHTESVFNMASISISINM